MAEFPKYEEMAKNVAEKALDEFLYRGKSIREWIQIIASDEQILTEIFVIYQKRIPAIAYKSNYIPRMGDIIHFPHFGGFRVKSVAYRIADDAGIDGNRLMWVELFVEKYEEINCKTTKCENAGGMNV